MSFQVLSLTFLSSPTYLPTPCTVLFTSGLSRVTRDGPTAKCSGVLLPGCAPATPNCSLRPSYDACFSAPNPTVTSHTWRICVAQAMRGLFLKL